MATKKNAKEIDLKSWGEAVAQLAAVEELVAYRRSLPEDMPAETRRELVVQRFHEAVEETARFEHPESPWLSAEFLEASVWDIARKIIDSAAERFGEMKVREALVKLAASGGFDDMACAWVEETVTTGEPAPYFELMHGGVGVSVIDDLAGEVPLPLVWAIVTPYTRMAELDKEIGDRCFEAFRGYPKPRPETVAEVARIVGLKKAGKTKEQIVWLLLSEEFPEIAALDSDAERKRQYPDDYRRKASRLRQLVHRLWRDTKSPPSRHAFR